MLLSRLSHLLYRAARISSTASDLRHGRVRNIANRVLTRAVYRLTSRLP